MSTQSILLAVLDLMTAHWKGYRSSVLAGREIDLLTAGDVGALASDCGLTPGQFRDVVRRGPRAADELGKVMAELGIDAESLRSKDRTTYNDMMLICTECGRKRICRKSISKGTVANDYAAFCNNSDPLSELSV